MKTQKNLKDFSVAEFIEAIKRLPNHDIRDGWIWWLEDYNNSGPYDRLPDQNHTARFAYNQMTHPAMQIWLMEASGVENYLVKNAKVESSKAKNKKTQCGIIRKHVPWVLLEQALWKS